MHEKRTFELSLIERIASPQVLQQAFAWLCRQRKDYPEGNDVWDLRRRWNQIQLQLRADLLSGAYRLRTPERIRREDSVIELWSSLDALVLKAAAIVLRKYLRTWLSSRYGGTVRRVYGPFL